MPIFIAHRGNLDGPEPELENNVDYLLDALREQYHVEIDIRILDSEIWFGHDQPAYCIDNIDEFEPYLDRCWFHAKNSAAINFLSVRGLRYFWHNKDSYTLTSSGHIWCYPTSDHIENCIINQPELVEPPELFDTRILSDNIGICTDYIQQIRDRYHELDNKVSDS